VGATDRVFETTLAYMFDRFSFGRPLASYQALKHRFADAKLWLEACRATTAAAARAVHEDAPDATELVSAAKSYVGDKATEIIQECVQMHGGMGVTWEHDIHLYLRRVTQNRVMYGTPIEHRERIATLLGQGAPGSAAVQA
jgi:alkylation response protein AidB-like acyl-CoA dehydrogenase